MRKPEEKLYFFHTKISPFARYDIVMISTREFSELIKDNRARVARIVKKLKKLKEWESLVLPTLQ